MSELTQFDYLLNAFEAASQSERPAENDYGAKRRALYKYVRTLETDRERYMTLLRTTSRATPKESPEL